MRDNVTEKVAKGNNGLYGNVSIECKVKVYRRDEYIHAIIRD